MQDLTQLFNSLPTPPAPGVPAPAPAYAAPAPAPVPAPAQPYAAPGVPAPAPAYAAPAQPYAAPAPAYAAQPYAAPAPAYAAPAQALPHDPFAGFDSALPGASYTNFRSFPGTHIGDIVSFSYEITPTKHVPMFKATIRVVQTDHPSLQVGQEVDWTVFRGAWQLDDKMVAEHFLGPARALIAAALQQPIDHVMTPQLEQARQGSINGRRVGIRVTPNINKNTGQPRVDAETGQPRHDARAFQVAAVDPAAAAHQQFQPGQAVPGFSSPAPAQAPAPVMPPVEYK
jgi:hypothetical protein